MSVKSVNLDKDMIEAFVVEQDREENDLLTIDFAALWAVVYRSRLWIGAIILGSVFAALIVSLLMTPIFEARSTVQIDQEAVKVIGTEDTESSASIQDADRFLQTQLDILRSRDLAKRVAQGEGYFKGDKFLDRMKINPEIDPVDGFEIDDLKEQLIIKTIQENLNISLPIDSRVASIRFESPDPRLAAQIANSYAENFIINNLQRKVDTSSYARDFLAKQLEEARARLQQSEAEANQYAERTRIIETETGDDGSRRSTLTTQTLVQLNEAYNIALSNRIAEEKKWLAIAKLPPLSIPQVNNNQAVQRLVEQYGIARARLDAERAKHLEAHPSVLQLEAEVAQLDKQIRSLTTNIRSGLRAGYDSAKEQERSLKQRLQQIEQTQVIQQRDGVRLNILSRESGTNRAQYESLLARYRQLDSEAGAQSNNLSIVDKAEVPIKPVKPNLLLNLAIGAFGGIALAFAFVFLREQIFDRIRTPDDIERKIKLALLGVTPFVEGETIDEIADPKSGLSESYSAARATLGHSSPSGLPKSTLITSASESEGKSTSCYALADNAAKLGKKILIIDGDLRRPEQHKLHGTTNEIGLTSILTNNATIEQAIQQIDDSSLHLLPSGPIPPNPAELLAGDNIRTLMDKLLSTYDHIFVDAPPVFGLADAIELSAITEKTVFVILSGKNKASDITKSMHRMGATQNTIVGCILTGFDAKRAGYGEQYGYYNYHYGNDKKD